MVPKNPEVGVWKENRSEASSSKAPKKTKVNEEKREGKRVKVETRTSEVITIKVGSHDVPIPSGDEAGESQGPKDAVFEKPNESNRHMKPLYIKGYIDGKPVSRMLVDGGVAVNLMPYSLFKKLGRGDDELKKTNMILNGFNDEPTKANGVFSVEHTVGNKTLPTTFLIIDAQASKKAHWDEIGIGQALDLTIANSANDEPLMAAASYFWSNIINTFLFNQGPMTPTLIDITMITGLDVTSSANPMSMNTKNQFDFRTKSIGGWSGYVAAYMGQGSVTPREHVAFLLMWLEKFLFCGSSCGPTTNWQFVAEALESKKEFPLGKILLGYLYQTLNNASAKIAVGSVVDAGGPWWLLQTWLHLMVRKVVNRSSVTEAEFPLPEPIVGDDGEERTHRRCTSYGEYASTPTDAGAKLSAELLKDWFCSFYEGFKKDAQTIDSSPPHQSNSGRHIEYAPGLIPNGGGLSLPELADAGKKRKTRSSAVSTLASSPKKKAKSKKTKPTDKPTDDLPALDPSIKQALDEEEIGEDVDQAAAEKKKTAVKKKPAATVIKSAPPVLADLFSFDIKDYLDEAEEDTSSKALAPLSDDVKRTLEDISHRLEASSLVDCGSIRTRLHEVQALIPKELADVLTLAAYLEKHQFKLEKAKLRLAERCEHKEIEATI
uniref:Uncharacterized protein n=1 Tax=Oryza sativa subsp. japonica TaxID=39947 RepID=Q75HR9_ORYSJ|nr:hypothetical protein [Oryza sativa Japonica Group]